MKAELNEKKLKEIVETGTTTVALTCKDSVVLAADQRVSYGYLNIHSLTKIIPINTSIAVTVAGGVGDNQILIRYIKSNMELWEMRRKMKPNTKACATLLSNILFGGKGYFPFYVQMLVAGYDNDGIPHVFSLGADGSIIEDKFVSTGSGSVMAYGVLDSEYKKDMEVNDCVKLAVKSINAAIKRDVFTGNGIDVFIIDKKGVRNLSHEDIKKISA